MTRAELRQLAKSARDAEAAFEALDDDLKHGAFDSRSPAGIARARRFDTQAALGAAHAAILDALDELNGLDCPTCSGAGSLDGLVPCGGCRGLGTRGGAHD